MAGRMRFERLKPGMRYSKTRLPVDAPVGATKRMAIKGGRLVVFEKVKPSGFGSWRIAANKKI